MASLSPELPRTSYLLHDAAARGDTLAMYSILRDPAFSANTAVTCPNGTKYYPLHAALYVRNTTAARMLKEAGASPELVSNEFRQLYGIELLQGKVTQSQHQVDSSPVLVADILTAAAGTPKTCRIDTEAVSTTASTKSDIPTAVAAAVPGSQNAAGYASVQQQYDGVDSKHSPAASSAAASSSGHSTSNSNHDSQGNRERPADDAGDDKRPHVAKVPATAASTWAGDARRCPFVELMLEWKADVSGVADLHLGTSWLHEVVRHKLDRSLAAKLVAAGTSLDAGDVHGNTALHYSLEVSDMEMCKTLLKLGANMNLFNKAGFTSFGCACKDGEVDMVKHMISLGADVNGGERRPLVIACGGTANQNLYRLGEGVPPTPQQMMYWRGVWHMAQAERDKYADIVKALLAHGADPQVKDIGGSFPMLSAADVGFAEVISDLAAAETYRVALAAITTVEKEFKDDSDDCTAIQVQSAIAAAKAAAAAGDAIAKARALRQIPYEHLVKAAQAAGVDVKTLLTGAAPSANRPDAVLNATPLFNAIVHGHTNTVEALLKAGADPNLPAGEPRKPPVLLAAKSGLLEVVMKLVEYGADWPHGRSAALVGSDVVQLLVENNKGPKKLQPSIVVKLLNAAEKRGQALRAKTQDSLWDQDHLQQQQGMLGRADEVMQQLLELENEEKQQQQQQKVATGKGSGKGSGKQKGKKAKQKEKNKLTASLTSNETSVRIDTSDAESQGRQQQHDMAENAEPEGEKQQQQQQHTAEDAEPESEQQQQGIADTADLVGEQQQQTAEDASAHAADTLQQPPPATNTSSDAVGSDELEHIGIEHLAPPATDTTEVAEILYQTEAESAADAVDIVADAAARRASSSGQGNIVGSDNNSNNSSSGGCGGTAAVLQVSAKQSSSKPYQTARSRQCKRSSAGDAETICSAIDSSGGSSSSTVRSLAGGSGRSLQIEQVAAAAGESGAVVDGNTMNRGASSTMIDSNNRRDQLPCNSSSSIQPDLDSVAEAAAAATRAMAAMGIVRGRAVSAPGTIATASAAAAAANKVPGQGRTKPHLDAGHPAGNVGCDNSSQQHLQHAVAAVDKVGKLQCLAQTAAAAATAILATERPVAARAAALSTGTSSRSSRSSGSDGIAEVCTGLAHLRTLQEAPVEAAASTDAKAQHAYSSSALDKVAQLLPPHLVPYRVTGTASLANQLNSSGSPGANLSVAAAAQATQQAHQCSAAVVASAEKPIVINSTGPSSADAQQHNLQQQQQVLQVQPQTQPLASALGHSQLWQQRQQQPQLHVHHAAAYHFPAHTQRLMNPSSPLLLPALHQNNAMQAPPDSMTGLALQKQELPQHPNQQQLWQQSASQHPGHQQQATFQQHAAPYSSEQQPSWQQDVQLAHPQHASLSRISAVPVRPPVSNQAFSVDTNQPFLMPPVAVTSSQPGIPQAIAAAVYPSHATPGAFSISQQQQQQQQQHQMVSSSTSQYHQYGHPMQQWHPPVCVSMAQPVVAGGSIPQNSHTSYHPQQQGYDLHHQQMQMWHPSHGPITPTMSGRAACAPSSSSAAMVTATAAMVANATLLGSESFATDTPTTTLSREPHSSCNISSAEHALKELRSLQEKYENMTCCVVCMDQPRSVLLLPCKHLALCEACSKDLQTTHGVEGCPVCRVPVAQYIGGVYMT